MVREGSGYSAGLEEIIRNQQHHRLTRPNQPHTIVEEDEDEHPIANVDEFSRRVVTEGMRDLFIALPNEAGRRIVDCEVNLATLQRMNIHAIQRDLVRLTSKIVLSGRMEVHPQRDETVSQALQVRKLMKEYCTAWRDWDLILKSASVAENDQFRITTHTALSACLIEEAGMLTKEMIFRAQEHLPVEERLSLRLLEPLDRNSTTSRLPGEPRHAALKDDKIQEATQRFFWGIGGGLALIGPMLLMVLHKTLLTTLLTSSLAVILFAFVVAMISSGLIPGTKTIDLGPRDVLAATATYAAVLVVFVGVSS
ncbi:uncharacterized protein PAC_16234 [Phialocephala subalpina]|uniref:DUF6594 domain-containing protein n=1 Tax=Phialocephala subalpina TaxID=576137 RepID=A0A1L7XMS9_9HELO|nr:uncharacterized protein PAC_16234 [Phialocephala subalpina]